MAQAFRTLKLLEQHHEKLAQLIKFQHSHPVSQPPKKEPEAISPPEQPAPAPVDSKKQNEGSPYRPKSQNLPAAHRPPRDVSSSIASNLASARGIPSNKQRRSGQVSSPALVSSHVEGKIVNPPKRTNRSDTSTNTEDSNDPEKVLTPASSGSRNAASVKAGSPPQDLPAQATNSDEPFQRFYSTFGSLFSKLSAPLAFAGLPLTPDEPPEAEKAPKKKATASKERTSVEPEYSRLFSKAALRAVREKPGGNHLGAAESFYVVPTTGGTMPYASMLARGGRFPGLDRNISRTSEDLDEFVDAKETPGPPSPLMTRGGKKAPKDSKTLEELQLENEGLRSLLDNVTRRLFEFEMGAQTSSIALQESIRASMKRSPVESTDGGVDIENFRKMEEQFTEGKKELERLGKENEKLKGVVGRYRERWEKLKEGARVRREGTGSGKDEPM